MFAMMKSTITSSYYLSDIKTESRYFPISLTDERTIEIVEINLIVIVFIFIFMV